MGDNIYLGDRDGVRTPMQWTPRPQRRLQPGRLRPALPAAAHGPGLRLSGRQRRGRDAQPELVPALDAADARSAPAAPRVRHRLVRGDLGRQPVGPRLRADLDAARGRRRAPSAAIPTSCSACCNLSRFAQPAELPSAAMGGQGADRAARSGAVPEDRRAAVLRHAWRPTGSTGFSSWRPVIGDAGRRCPTAWRP